jgi:hypothetical protein
MTMKHICLMNAEKNAAIKLTDWPGADKTQNGVLMEKPLPTQVLLESNLNFTMYGQNDIGNAPSRNH